MNYSSSYRQRRSAKAIAVSQRVCLHHQRFLLGLTGVGLLGLVLLLGQWAM